MGDAPKPPGSKRAGTVIEPSARGLGPRNDDRGHIPSPPRGVGLTQAPFLTVRSPASPTTSAVPRREFDFEQKTPPTMDPNTYHAIRTMRDEVLTEAQAILRLVNAEVTAREEREAKQAKEENAARELALSNRRKWIAAMVTTIGIAIAGIVAAAVHGCS